MPTLTDYETSLAAILAAMDTDEYSEEEVAAAVGAYLGEAEGLADKLDAYAAIIAERENYAALRKSEAERLQGLAKSDTARATWLRARLLAFMQLTGRDRIETDLHKFRVQANGGKRAVIVSDADALPAEYLQETVTVRPNSEAIREALERGDTVPGATLAERGHSVRIG